MKNFLLSLILILFFPFAMASSFATTDNSINTKINTLISNFGEDINIGIVVEDAQTGNVIYKRNANRYYMPASNQKLFTAYAALKLLGPNFTYKTSLYFDKAKIQQGMLNDDAYLQFSGDPTLTLTQLDGLISSMSKAGIKHINGDLIVDDSLFDQRTMSPGTTWEDKDFCWGAPISTIIIDNNCVSATLMPAEKSGQPASLQLPDQRQFMQFINHATTGKSNAKDCVLDVKLNGETAYSINGCIKQASDPKTIMMAIADPRLNAQAMLTYLLSKNQITMSGKIKFKQVMMPSANLVVETSQPLTELIIKMLKESDNTIANALFKTVGAHYQQTSGDWENGNQAVHDILYRTIQLDIPKTTLIDGAGGSRYNFFTPWQIATLLQNIYLSNDAAIFMAALPVAGVDGTLKNRMKAVETMSKVRAKTGTATAVSTLSGYLQTNTNQVLVFSIMINNFVDLPAKYEALEDKICQLLIESG